MKKKIVVSIGYFDFYFDDVEEAVVFADSANKHVEAGRSVSISITYEDEEDENETEQ